MLRYKLQTSDITYKQAIIIKKMQKPHYIYSIAQSLPIISTFLSQQDRVHFHNTSSIMKQLTCNSSFWPSLQLTTSTIKPQNMISCLKWFFKAMRKYQPAKITIFMYEINQSIIQILVSSIMEGTVDSVTSLDLYCESDDLHLACSLCFPNLEELTIRSRCATNQLVQLMAENLTNLDSLVVIKNDIDFTCKNITKYMKNPMKKLIMKPYLVQFDELQIISNSSSSSLLQLELDVEQCQASQIIKIIEPLRQLQKLRLYHLQNLQSDQPLADLLSEQSKIQQISITKANNFQMSRILAAVSSKNLLRLDISQSKYANDLDIKRLAQQCCYLRQINISWCNSITSQGLKYLIANCLDIQALNMTGIKDSKDQIFQQYLRLLPIFDQDKFTQTKNEGEQNPTVKQKSQIYEDDYFFRQNPRKDKIRTLRKLRMLDCQSCNVISDKMLKVIYTVNRRSRNYNYYGNYMGLFPNDSQIAFC